MAQYINKDTLITKIENLIKRAEAERVLYPQTIKAAKNLLLIEDYKKLLSIIDTFEVEIGVDLGDSKGDKSVKYILDTKTFEMKEVDFEIKTQKAKEIAGYKPDENPEIPMFQGQDGDKYACFESVMAMADFKDMQPISELGGWQTEPPTKDCTVLLYITEQTLTVSRWNSPNKMFYDEYLGPIKHWLKWKLI